MNGYVCFWKGKRLQISAETSYQAQCKAGLHWKIHPKKQHEVTVVLAEKAGEPVIHTAVD
jgi:hypothetical protein